VDQRENPWEVGFGASRTLGAPREGIKGPPYAGRMPRRQPLKVPYTLKGYPIEIP
jgi:hypothetical protein